MEIEDRLRKFRLAALPAGLKQRTLASAKPWRPWYLAAAALSLIACAGVSAWSEARLHETLAVHGAIAPEELPAGSMNGRFVVSGPPSIRAESLISLKHTLEDNWR